METLVASLHIHFLYIIIILVQNHSYDTTAFSFIGHEKRMSMFLRTVKGNKELTINLHKKLVSREGL